jgi:oligopeptide transport system ATP-binding protein
MQPLLKVENLRVSFPVLSGVLLRKTAEVTAVDDVSFDLTSGETLGLVGESGCGKSTIGRAIVNILHAMSYGVKISGKILYHDGEKTIDLLQLNRSSMRPFRSKIQMIFQDPFSSLNPRMTIQEIIEEPLKLHSLRSATERKDRIWWLLEKVGLTREQAGRYPHEFSGGQRQRIGIARALATNPTIVIADEPVSALDVSIQAQIINLMQDLQEEFNLSYLFIAHDLSIVRHISNRIAVMYLGNLVELGPAETIYQDPLHPYAQALLSAIPRSDFETPRRERIKLTGDIPTPLHKPSGCGFRTRCPIAHTSCALEDPKLEFHRDRLVACPRISL